MARTINTGIALQTPGLVSIFDAQGYAEILVRFANGADTVEFAPPGSDDFETLHVEESKRKLLRRWLRGAWLSRRDTLREINAAFKQITLDSYWMDSEVTANELKINLQIALVKPTIEAQFAWLLANVMHFGFLQNIRCCPECSIYFTDYPSKRKIRDYCSPAHSNAHRQRQYRKRKSH